MLSIPVIFSYNQRRITLLLFLIFMMGCAAVAPPPGGPVDKTPPSLLTVTPPSGTTQILGGHSVLLTFSERLDETTVSKGIQLLPGEEEPLVIKIKKTMVKVDFPHHLNRDQTYILTITRNIVDEHKNRLDRVYQIAYSTGVQISKGVIRGTVYGSPEKSTLVYLYRYWHIFPDSLLLRKPEYTTETDDQGIYTFSYLDSGNYQVIAFTGGRPPAPVVPSRMRYGLYWKSFIHVTDQDTINDVNIRLFNEVPPFKLITVQMKNHFQGFLRFSNPVELSPQNSPTLLFRKESLPDVIPEFLFQDGKNSREIWFHSSSFLPKEEYILTVSHLKDSTDQTLEETSREITIPDRDSVKISIQYPEVGKKISLFPDDIPLMIQFTGGVKVEEGIDIAILTDTSGLEIGTNIVWKNPVQLSIIPTLGWEPETEYHLDLMAPMMKSFDEIPLADSTITYTLSVGQKRGVGGMRGLVKGPYVTGTIVVAKSTEKPPLSRTSVVNLTGSFNFKDVPAGYWMLSAFQDMDGNGRYTPGKVFPFQPSEPFLVLQDTIEVRANWDVEGIELIYPDNE